jgi:hypothetical protein
MAGITAKVWRWRDFGALAGLASSCPFAAILLHALPRKTLCDQFRLCFGAWVRQIVDGLQKLEL